MRPSFEDILQALDTIVHSAFTQTPHESFHTMQEDWKQEIEEVLHGLRMKEKVSVCLIGQAAVSNRCRYFTHQLLMLCFANQFSLFHPSNPTEINPLVLWLE